MFCVDDYLELQSFVFKIAQAIRRVLDPERVYILSLGSKSANAHVHWHVAPLPAGVPLDEQQYYALMHENGVIDTTPEEMLEFASALRSALSSVDGA